MVKLCELFYTLKHCSDVCSVGEEVTALCKFIHLIWYEKAMMFWSLRRKLQDGRPTLFPNKTLKVLSIVTWNYRLGLMNKLATVAEVSIYVNALTTGFEHFLQNSPIINYLFREVFLVTQQNWQFTRQKKLFHLLQHWKCEMTQTMCQWLLHQ